MHQCSSDIHGLSLGESCKEVSWARFFQQQNGRSIYFGQRITALRVTKSFSESRIYSDWAYDESQMKEADFGKREQKSHLEYDC